VRLRFETTGAPGVLEGSVSASADRNCITWPSPALTAARPCRHSFYGSVRAAGHGRLGAGGESRYPVDVVAFERDAPQRAASMSGGGQPDSPSARSLTGPVSAYGHSNGSSGSRSTTRRSAT
jgi:hypothetical protein